MRELELPDVQDVMLEYRKIKLLYRSALKEIGTKLEILNDCLLYTSPSPRDTR